MDKENEIVEELRKEVLQKIKEVKVSYFMPFGRLTKRLGSVIILSYIIILTSALNIQIIDYNDAIAYTKDFNLIKKGAQLADFTFNDSDIYGNASLADLGDDEIQIRLSRTSSDIDLSRLEDIKEKEFKESFPDEIYAKQASGYDDNVPKDYREIVKNYYTGIAEVNK